MHLVQFSVFCVTPSDGSLATFVGRFLKISQSALDAHQFAFLLSFDAINWDSLTGEIRQMVETSNSSYGWPVRANEEVHSAVVSVFPPSFPKKCSEFV